MTALRLIAPSDAPVPAKPPAVPPAPAPGRYPYCLGQPVAALRSRVEMASELLRLTGRPFDWDSAVADYMVETDGGKPEAWGLEDRAARWGWDISRSGLSRRMGRIREDAADRADLYRSKRAGDERRERADAAARFGAPSEPPPGSPSGSPSESDPAGSSNQATGPQRDATGSQRPRNENAADGPVDGDTRNDPATPSQQGRNALATPAPHIPRASDLRPHTHTEEDADAARARARRVLDVLGEGSPDGPFPEAVVAEAEDAAAGRHRLGHMNDPVALASLAVLGGPAGRPPDDVLAVLAGLDPPAAAALLVAVLRRGRAPTARGRTRFLERLAHQLHDHDAQAQYAADHPDRDGPPGPGHPAPGDDGDGGRRRGGAPPAAGRRGGGRTGPRNARERANELDARTVAASSADALALLRADPDLGGDPPGGGA